MDKAVSSKLHSLWLAIAVGVCGFFAAQVFSQNAHNSFTLIVEEKVINPANNEVLWRRPKYFARRRDGARVTGPYGATDPTVVRDITVPTEGLSVVVSDLTGTKFTLFGPPNKAPGDRAIDGTCASSAPPDGRRVGEEDILGLRTVHYQRGREHDAMGNAVDFEMWLAPDLRCRPLKETSVRTAPGGEITGRFERVAVKIDIAEPDAALFRVPESYREVKPSEQYRAIFEATNPNAKMPERVAKTMETMDRRYEAAQVYRR
jgi:hypothetical protein